MAQSNLLVEAPEAPRRGLLLVAAAVGAVLILYLLNGGSYYPVLGIVGLAGAIAVYKASAITRMDRQWLIVPLTMLAIFVNSLFLDGCAARRISLWNGDFVLRALRPDRLARRILPARRLRAVLDLLRVGAVHDFLLAWRREFSVAASPRCDPGVLRDERDRFRAQRRRRCRTAGRALRHRMRLLRGPARALRGSASAQHYLGRSGSLHPQSTGRTFPRAAQQSQRRWRLDADHRRPDAGILEPL